MKQVFTLIFLAASLWAGPRVLHMTFHQGCAKEFEYVAEQLGLDLTTQYVHDLPPEKFDGTTSGSARYNVGHERAKRVWEINRDFYEQFDLIVTSDTAPLSRIFLQNGWDKPLIIWVCNRFDYAARRFRDCPFPDPEYFQLIAATKKQKNVKIFSYTPFEHRYARLQRKIDAWSETIKPTGGGSDYKGENSLIPASLNREENFFVPPYHNDTIYMDLSAKLGVLGITHYRGRYAGPWDLKDFKGIIHIPYAWSNLALFENWSNGLIYFVPSKRFLLQLSRKKHFFWTPTFPREYIEDSERYTPQHADLFVYFDSWEDLVEKVKTTDYDAMRERILRFSQKHQEEMLNRWRIAIDTFP